MTLKKKPPVASIYLTAQDLSHVGVGDQGTEQSDAVFHSRTGTSKTVAGLPAEQ